MNTTIIIAQILGIVFVVLGASLFTNKKSAVALLEETTKNTATLWLFGFLSLIMGAIIVTFNNFWSSGLELFITIIGWLALLKGIAILLLPNYVTSIYKNYKDGNMLVWAGVIVCILGFVLMLGA